MNLRDLKYLIAVAKHQHFGKAAEACFISQPALSMQLKKLEEYLDVQLFERNNKTVIITEIGKKLVEQAKKITQAADDMIVLAKTFQNPEEGEVKLGAFPTLAPYYLPKSMPKIIKKFPKLKLFLLEEKTDILITKLLSGEIDTAFLATPMPLSDHQKKLLESIELFKEPFYLAVSKSHPLAKLKKITQNNIKNEKLLLLEDGHCLRQQALDVCEITGAFEQQDFRATSLETLREMVAANIGITLVPELAINKKDSRINYLPFCNHKYARTISMVWRKTSARAELFQELIKAI